MIKSILDKAKSNRYGKAQHYNRSRALTDAMIELEAKAKKDGKDFKITSASVVKLHLRETEISSNVFENYVSFIYGGNKFYIQYDDNPLFDTSYIRASSLRETSIVDTHHIRIWQNALLDELYKYSEENIASLRDKLLSGFYTIYDNKNRIRPYRRKIDSVNKWDEDRIYY